MNGLYVHIPFCHSKCRYCDFASYAAQEHLCGEYISALIEEARLRRGVWDFAPDTVFIGGGTPTLLPPEELHRLFYGLKGVFRWDRVVECTVEANPGTLDERKMETLVKDGVNRLSLGLQAAQPKLLASIGRIHSREDFIHAVELAGRRGIKNINGDMMTGLPGQTIHDVLETVELLIELGLTHVSCYALTLSEGTPMWEDVQKGRVQVPGDDEEREMFHAMRSALETAGYARYEISNFAKPGLECAHNLIYWNRGHYLGLGCAAASYDGECRWENERSLASYLSALQSGCLPQGESQTLSSSDKVFESIMLGLRKTEGMDLDGFKREFGFALEDRWPVQLEKLLKQGLLQKQNRRLRPTLMGMDLLNTVLLEFME